MPLAFTSASHGKIAFGFFNIYSDMLLLEEHFFFADKFCETVIDIARQANVRGVFTREFSAYTIGRPEDIGDLMGAIHGVRFVGFIGETYRKHPFPSEACEFRQRRDGFLTQIEFDEMIKKYGKPVQLSLSADADAKSVFIGQYQFDQGVFAQLLQYVWKGGYPRWKDEQRPTYVQQMVEAVLESDCWLFTETRFV